MSSILSSQSVVLATAMAVSGTVILLAARRLQKPPSTTAHFPLLPSCIIPSSDEGKKRKKKKKVHFAEDVVDPIGNSEEYRKSHKANLNKYSNSTTLNKGRKIQEMPANRLALYNGMLRDRVLHKVAYACS
ncbi:uncharacterized protein LOC130988292 [Salvia miltiorrhiza]|uniref:uncharacterized protein LOC130988292 n=1 Tax=Salvia miltiorrhiza TaxID=226208 RepID=UPI0025AC2F6A|nr:uncharacterized protein LOC130988292 [Salvia miltiorrhiza]